MWVEVGHRGTSETRLRKNRTLAKAQQNNDRHPSLLWSHLRESSRMPEWRDTRVREEANTVAQRYTYIYKRAVEKVENSPSRKELAKAKQNNDHHCSLTWFDVV